MPIKQIQHSGQRLELLRAVASTTGAPMGAAGYRLHIRAAGFDVDRVAGQVSQHLQQTVDMIGLGTGMIVPQRFQIIGQRVGDGDLDGWPSPKSGRCLSAR